MRQKRAYTIGEVLEKLRELADETTARQDEDNRRIAYISLKGSLTRWLTETLGVSEHTASTYIRDLSGKGLLEPGQAGGRPRPRWVVMEDAME